MATPGYALLPKPTTAAQSQFTQMPEADVSTATQVVTGTPVGGHVTDTGTASKPEERMSAESISTVESVAENPFLRLFTRLGALGKLPENWNSYGALPPNRTALFRAHRVLQEALRSNFPPQAVKASPDEGVGIVFVSAKGQSAIECLNTGNIFLVLSGTSSAGPIVRPVSQTAEHIKEAIEEIQSLLLP